MAEDKEPIIRKSNEPAGLSNEQLMRMLIDSQRQQAEAQNKLSEALLESRKPYVDPKVLAQKQQELEEKKRAIEIELRNRQIRKQSCPHIRDNGTSNIKWMEHSNAITKGVCGSCFSEFDTRNPKDLEILRHDVKSLRNMARAGAHTYTKQIGRV